MSTCQCCHPEQCGPSTGAHCFWHLQDPAQRPSFKAVLAKLAEVEEAAGVHNQDGHTLLAKRQQEKALLAQILPPMVGYFAVACADTVGKIRRQIGDEHSQCRYPGVI